VWDLFDTSADEAQAREALARLKLLPVERDHPERFEKVVRYLEGHFEWMTAYLRHDGVRRNSLAESGMRVYAGSKSNPTASDLKRVERTVCGSIKQ
jgi:hypothetical protein